jgi:REP-associated tyrosine transposase
VGRLTHRTGPGWTYFITTKTWQSRAIFQVEETAVIVVRKLLECRDRGSYLLHEFVVMPNHLHLLITPADSVRLEKAMQLIKGGSSREIHAARGGKMPIWQAGFHESRVTSWTEYRKKRDYIHFNPVAAKLVERPELWVHGSASGAYELDPIPQGLKPIGSQHVNVGAKAPTPGAPTEVRVASGAKVPVGRTVTRGLKPPPPKEQSTLQPESSGLGKLSSPRPQADVGAEAPTPAASAIVAGASGAEAPVAHAVMRGLKPPPPKEQHA